jgi:hypothetical protein
VNPSPWPAACMFGALFGLLALLAVALFENIRARRNEEQVETDSMMRRGFRAAKRMGLLRDDVQ